MPERRILALNCGSSSLKFGLYSSKTLLLEGEAEEIGRKEATFWIRSGEQPKVEKQQSIADHGAALKLATEGLSVAGFSRVDAVGHRIVHGGPKVRNHQVLDAAALQALKEAVSFAPLHLPPSLAVIDAVSNTMANVPQVICLDTAFHKDLPDVSKTLPLPRKTRDQGVERYGFHGLSVESIVAQLNPPPVRTIVAHLGSGASITALLHGRSIDTTMGLTPSGGIMMGTRCGDLDPGALIYLLREGLGAEQLESIVNHESGLKGVSENSSDVRELTAKRQLDVHCDLALRMFSYQVKKAVAAMAASLGGLDLLVFTGGIGEHAAAIRNEVCQGLAFLGQFEMKVLPSQEDLQIVRIAARLLN